MTIHKATTKRRSLQIKAFFDKLPTNEKTGRLTPEGRYIRDAWLAQEGIGLERARQILKEAANPAPITMNSHRIQECIGYLTERGFTVTKN